LCRRCTFASASAASRCCRQAVLRLAGGVEPRYRPPPPPLRRCRSARGGRGALARHAARAARRAAALPGRGRALRAGAARQGAAGGRRRKGGGCPWSGVAAMVWLPCCLLPAPDLAVSPAPLPPPPSAGGRDGRGQDGAGHRAGQLLPGGGAVCLCCWWLRRWWPAAGAPVCPLHTPRAAVCRKGFCHGSSCRRWP
jgi:hypothetical protein